MRLIVFEDMRGKTLNIGIVSPASDFDEILLKVQKVLDSVKYRGSWQRLESIVNSAERPHRNANLSVRSVLLQSPVFRIRKPFLSKFITTYKLLFTEGPGRGILRSSYALS